MSSTYSSYKFELIGTGEQAGTWGTTTNTNIGTSLEQAIGGYVAVTFTGLTKTLILTDTNAVQDARALYLNLTGSPGGTATLELPAIQKAYIIKNSTTGGFSVTVKVTGMTGVIIPNGATMPVYNNGTDVVEAINNINKLGIGTGSLTGRNLSIASDLTGATTSVSLENNPRILSDVTTQGYGYRSNPSTQAAAFTLPEFFHYAAVNFTVGAGSTLTKQSGFTASSSLTAATNNYGFEGNLVSGSNTWNIYSQGTAPIYLAGKLLVGTTATTDYKVRFGGTVSATAGTSGMLFLSPAFDSSVTGNGNVFITTPSTAASAFTMSALFHYTAGLPSIGAGSAITSQHGYRVNDFSASATNNYALSSAVSNTGNSWNLYAVGTAPNYMAGALGIGTTTTTGYVLRLSRNFTGATTTYGASVNTTILSDSTTAAYSFISSLATEAVSWTLTGLSHFSVQEVAVGAGNTITNQYGFRGITGNANATNNYFLYGTWNTGAGNTWNVYAQGTAPNYMAGSLGVGTTSVTNFKIRVGGVASATAGTTTGVYSNITADSTVTDALMYASAPVTQASAFTLSNLYHYLAQAPSIGAGSTVTSQHGFKANDFSAGATNNYGYTGGLAAGANNWNIYANGNANNYMAGALGIGATSLTGSNLRITRNLTGATTSTSIANAATILSDVTSNAYGIYSELSTQAAAFTLPILQHYRAEGGTRGAGSTITEQHGFYASGGLTQATTNIGFFSAVAAAANSWNFYANGTANNYMAGALGIGATALTGYGLRVGKNLTGAAVSYQVSANYTVQSDVSGARTFQSAPSTQATAFTLGSLYHFVAEVPGVGAGSTITNQYGFLAANGLEVATNNYGFGSSIASGANNWNIYSSGTAKNYLAGALGIGATSSTASLAVNRNLTGATSNSQVVCSYTVLSDVTGTAYTFESFVQTQASATLGNLIHYHVSGLIPGGGSTITNQYGIQIDDISGATNNYGVYSNLTSGSNRWNFYALGTANNALRGNTRFGDTTAPVATVDVTGNVAATTSILSTGDTSGVGYAAGAGGVVTQLTSRTTGVTLNKVSGAITLVSAAGSAAYQSFTVTNSAVAATDVIIVNQKSGTDKYITLVTNVAAGSFQITFATTGGTTTEQPVFNFAVIKAVAA